MLSLLGNRSDTLLGACPATCDSTRVIQSPVTTTTADMIAGDDGWLFRTQVQIGF